MIKNSLIYSKLRSLWKPLKSKFAYVLFLNSKSDLKSEDMLYKKKGNLIDIVTIAFNNAKTIEYQIKLVRKNLTEAHTHIIADNSTDIVCRQIIHNLCRQHGVFYISIPKNDYRSNYSHSSAIHWVYKNVLVKRKSQFCGFIDHDIFPIQPCSIVNRMRNGIYGRVTPAYSENEAPSEVSEKQPYWSLWAGFFFVESKLLFAVNPYLINFNPKTTPNGLYLDTGGGLWDSIIKNIPYPGELAKYSNVRFRETSNGNIHTDYYECLDEWLHIGNLSNWYDTPNLQEKNNYFDSLLNNALVS